MGSERRSTTYEAARFDYGRALALERELGVPSPIAITLVRRGYSTAEQARSFLAADEAHDPYELSGMEQAVGVVRDAIASEHRITVHGDYDADGVCATAILVRALREAGAECDWLIPERLADGYGLSEATVERIAARGSRLIVTVDCGIASPDEIEHARSLGLDVLVTDHHRPGERVPQCPILHPGLAGYPGGELCGAGVAGKLAAAISGAERDVDLIALATVADMVPLAGENRRLVREGLAEIRRAPRPGLRALIASAGVGAERLDEGDISFRLAPRINAVGRVSRADAAVELMLASDDASAGARAEELEEANRERRAVEERVRREAEAALGSPPPAGIVLAGEGWHPGVLGIVASRIADQHWRPAILLAIEDGRARGSGRAIADFDLLGALEACSEHLGKFGGHRAAAGLELDAEQVPAFAAAFAVEAARRLGEEPPVPAERVDAFVGGPALSHELARELDRLGPFGIGNPRASFLVPGARIGDVRRVGEDGRHARFAITSGPGRADGIAFSVNGELDALTSRPADVSVRLELNHWNGSVSPQAVFRAGYPLTGTAPEAHQAEGPALERWIEHELSRDLDEAEGLSAEPGPATAVDRRGEAILPHLAELLASGASVAAVCADVLARRSLAGEVLDPARFGRQARVAGARMSLEALAPAKPEPDAFLLTDWAALSEQPHLVDGFVHVVAIDPPPDRGALAAAQSAEYLHLLWGEPELELAWRVLAAEWRLREPLGGLFRAARAAGASGIGADGGCGAVPALSPAALGRCVRILCESELGEWHPAGSNGERGLLRVVSSERTDLDRSAAWRRCRRRFEEGDRFLSAQTTP